MSNAYTFEVPLAGRLAFSMPEVAKMTGLPLDSIHRQIKVGTFHTHLVGRHRVATLTAIAEMLGTTREELLGQDGARPKAYVTIGKAA
jgi:hypothetical protein